MVATAVLSACRCDALLVAHGGRLFVQSKKQTKQPATLIEISSDFIFIFKALSSDLHYWVESTR